MNDQSDSRENTGDTKQEDPYSFLQGDIFDDGNVFPAIRLRRFIQIGNGFDWFVLGCRYSFLWHFRFFLVGLYIAYSILK